MTNYGALAILALPDQLLLLSDLRLLIALETVTADAMGYREIGMNLLAQKAQLPYSTARKSASRLTTAGLLFCVPGSGKGHLTRWRIQFSLDRPKVSTQDGHLTDTQRCPPEAAKVSTEPAKGVHPNSVTSTNANTGLKDSGLNQSGLAPAPTARAPDLIAIIIHEIHQATGSMISDNWAAKIKNTILDGREPADAAAYIRHAIRAEPDPRTRFLPIRRPGYGPP